MKFDIDNHQYRCHIDGDRYSNQGRMARWRNRTMSDANLTNWAFGTHFNERERFHEVALFEARTASEYRTVTTPKPPTERLLTRVRIALGLASRPETCDCAVAA
jgi:hypothetical protein